MFPDTKIEDNSRAFKLQKANFDSEVNTAVRRQEKIDELVSLFYLNISRKLRRNWPTNFRQPRSSRESNRKNYKSR